MQQESQDGNILANPQANPQGIQGAIASFDIRNFQDRLEPDGGSESKTEKSFYCLVCGAKNFKIRQESGKYGTYACDCARSEQGKREIRGTVAPRSWEKPPRPKARREWTYCDRDGQRLIKVTRSDDGNGTRRFWQEPLVQGKEPAELAGQCAPYRYQECLKAIANGQRIFWAEGEGVADALRKIGIPATTTIGGSGGYKSERYGGLFPGAQLVICPDRDQAGIKYAEAIAQDYPEAQWLYAFPSSYLWSQLPQHGGAEIADWIEDGATADQILAAIEPKREPKAPSNIVPFRADVAAEPDLDQQIREILGRNLKPSERAKALNQISKSSRIPYQQIEAIAEAIELEDQSVDVAGIKLELAKHGPTFEGNQLISGQIGRGLSELAKTINSNDHGVVLSLLTQLCPFINPKTCIITPSDNASRPYQNPAILWVLLWGLSGLASKSESINACNYAIQTSNVGAKKDYENETRQYKRDLRAWELNGKDPDTQPTPPLRRKYSHKGGSIPGLIKMAAEQNKPFTGIYDEFLTLFGAIDQSGNGKAQTSDRPDLINLWDGKDFPEKELVGRGNVDGDPPRYSLIAGIQPSKFKGVLPKDPTQDTDGYWGRFLFVKLNDFRDSKPGNINLDHAINDAAKRLESWGARGYVLSPDAKEEYLKYKAIEISRVNSFAAKSDEFMIMLYSRQTQQVCRIALVAHLVDHALQGQEPPNEISLFTMQGAIALMEKCLADAVYIFKSYGIGPGDHNNLSEKIAAFVKQYAGKGPITWATIKDAASSTTGKVRCDDGSKHEFFIRSKKGRGKPSKGEVLAFLDLVVRSGYATWSDSKDQYNRAELLVFDAASDVAS